MKAKIISDDLGRVYEMGIQSNDLIEEIVDADSNHNFWATFRREVAKDMLPITSQMKIAKDDVVLRIVSKETAVKLAIEYADELIKQLGEWKK